MSLTPITDHSSASPPDREAPLPQQRRGVARDGKLRAVHRHRTMPAMRSIGALMLREMTTTNGRAAGGYLWEILEPLGGIAILAIVFSFALRTPPMGTNFIIFYATGIVPFTVFLNIQGKTAQSLTYSKALLTYPAVTFMDALLARIAMNMITQALVAYLVFMFIVITQDTRTDPQIIGITLAFAMACSFGIGVGTVNCFLNSAFPWWPQVWGILMRPLFFLSCLFFIFDDVPMPLRDWLWYNPLIHVVGQMRRSFYPSYAADYVSHVYVFGVSLALTLTGLLLLYKYHRDLMNS